MNKYLVLVRVNHGQRISGFKRDDVDYYYERVCAESPQEAWIEAEAQLEAIFTRAKSIHAQASERVGSSEPWPAHPRASE